MRYWKTVACVITAAASAWLLGPERAVPDLPGAVTQTTTVHSSSASEQRLRGREAFVGSAVCASCHRAESALYESSHHAKALVRPSPEMAKARFDGAEFRSKLGGTTKFSVHDGAASVTTLVAGAAPVTYPIAYVSGVWPLEQYVVSTERGKLQSLGVVWDSRSDAKNRWFHVYGRDGVAPGDALYFTAPAQNWNHMCADCHSTFVERRYDPAADAFDTRWTELSVGCEACHGPGAEHARSAKNGKPVPFPVRFDHGDPWIPSAATGSPPPRPIDGVEVEVCAPCHSRREPIREGFTASDALLDFFEPELLLPGRYHADGQVEGEVYEWGSFLQSRMYHAGVSCSDCHNPHSGKPFATGNALCVRCHEAARFDAFQHTRHTADRAPLCIDCHMPKATFMQIDERRDHSLRIPRPDHSVMFGTPNACNGCHDDKPAAWARDHLSRWFPEAERRPHFVEALGKDLSGASDAPRALRSLAADAAAPALARATALLRLGRFPGGRTREALASALASSDSLVAYGAALGAAELPPRERVALLSPALGHRTRAVRLVAAKALAGVPSAELSAKALAALGHAVLELEQSFDVGASRAELQVEKSGVELARGRLDAARSSLERALRLEPCLVEAKLNLAELERQRGDEAAAESALRAALRCEPASAAAHHARGLWLVRNRRPEEALASLQKAVALAPADARFSYALAVALAGNGEHPAAVRVLEASLEHHPNDVDALQALAAYLREIGALERERQARQRLTTLAE